MDGVDLVVAVVAGLVQGVVEWLPVSSQGNLAAVLAFVGTDPETAVQLALFLQAGTTLSAVAYYREEIALALRALPGWRVGAAYDGENALASYIVVASLLTGLVGVPLYVFAVDLAGELSGGAFVVLIGVLLVATGLVQVRSESLALGTRQQPTLLDSLLVGAAQGVAILPGVSRSGVTTSVLLFRSYEPSEAFRLSFLLSIPATFGAAVLTVVGAGGLPGIAPGPAVAALLVSSVVGYVSIDAIMRVVERIPFWQVCFGLGALAIAGGGLVVVA
jgi:undecaprenyl-diphosphatase